MHSVRPSEPRLTPLPELVDRIRESMKDQPINAVNVVGTMARNRVLSKAFNPFAQAVLFKGGLSRRLVELVVLRMGWNCQAIYEFGQHTMFGRDVGLTDAEIYGLTRPLSQHPWTAEERAALQMVDDLYSDDCVSDAAWAAGAEHFDDAEMIHIVLAAGCYRVVSGFLNSAGVQLDEGVPGWPEPPSNNGGNT